MRNATLPLSPHQKDIPDLVSTEFEWPSSSLPSIANIDLAESLCNRIVTDETPTRITACNTAGWSAQDCIKVERAGQRFMVKIPRIHTPDGARTCRSEGARAKWAGDNGIGPKVSVIDEGSGGYVMRFVDGEALTPEMAAKCAGRVVELLRRLHAQRGAEAWMGRYDPVAVVRDMLKLARVQGTMGTEEIHLIGRVIDDAAKAAGGEAVILKPCHNDFHSLNIMIDRNDELFCIDSEDMNLADPMWDLAYFTANIDLPPIGLADIYGCSEAERIRLKAFHALAIAHFATWSATHGPQWKQHAEDCLQRLRIQSVEAQ